MSNFFEIDTKVKPSKRYDHCMATDGNDKIYLFGGMGIKYKSFNDLWVFNINFNDISKSFWEKVPIKSDIKPKNTYGANMVYYDNKLYIIFGKNEDGNYTKDFWVFNIKTGMYNKIDTKGQTITQMGFVSANIYQDKVYLFGGNTPRGMSNRLYTFDLNNLLFRRVKLKNNDIIEPRWRHQTCIIGDQMLIYGGFNKNDVFSIKLNDKHPIVSKVAIKLKPICESSMMVCGNDMMIYGGYIVDDKRYISDVQLFKGIEHCASISQYRLLTKFGKSPPERGRHCGVVCKDIAFVFGGYTYGNISHLYNDIWCYSFKDNSVLQKSFAKAKKLEIEIEQKQAEPVKEKKRRLSQIYQQNLISNKAFNELNILVRGLSHDDEKTPISSAFDMDYEAQFDKLTKKLESMKQKNNENDAMLREVLMQNGTVINNNAPDETNLLPNNGNE